MAHLGSLTKAMMMGYLKQLQTWLDGRGLNKHGVERDRVSQLISPAADVDHTFRRATTTQTQQEIDIMDAQDWPDFDFGSGNMEYFDETAWETIMSDFTLPTG